MKYSKEILVGLFGGLGLRLCFVAIKHKNIKCWLKSNNRILGKKNADLFLSVLTYYLQGNTQRLEKYTKFLKTPYKTSCKMLHVNALFLQTVLQDPCEQWIALARFLQSKL